MTNVFFSATDATHGNELWVTDIGTGSTSLVADINPGVSGSSPQKITHLGGGRVVFTADDGTHGAELWVSDGTSGGTSLLKDINAGGGTGSESSFTSLGNGRAVFTANDGTHGAELWVTDGTTGGTSLLKDIATGATGSSPASFTSLGNGRVVFTADDGTHGTELWVTDGTASGTSLLQDINAGASGTLLSAISSLDNGHALFLAAPGGLYSYNYQLWVTDGTSGGTSLGQNNAFTYYPPTSFTSIGSGRALFISNNSGDGFELWVTNGTAAGTSLVADINPGTSSSSISGVTSLGGGRAIFQANDGIDGYELWISDGTTGGTSLLKDINPLASGSSFPGTFTSLGNGSAVFQATDGSHGQELWITNGTAAGTTMVQDISLGVTGSSPHNFVSLGDGRAMFTANDGTNGDELWITDGTAAGTSMLQDIVAGATGSAPANLVLACFLRGTAILTPTGEVAVESLRPGDAVRTWSGQTRSIVWIGSGRAAVTPYNRCDAAPVIVRAGALADGVPMRDLHVTRHHAVLVDDLLVPVEHLINDISIVWDDRADLVEYYHIELEKHDILVANGAPAESFRDDNSAQLFDNSPSRPAAAKLPPCAEVIEHGAALEYAWRLLAERAGATHATLTRDPDLHLLVDGTPIRPSHIDGKTCLFDLPPDARRVAILSRHAIPAVLGTSRDRRRLGVALGRISLHHGGGCRDVALDDPALTDGFTDYEGSHRWTKGHAELPDAATAGLIGPVQLELQVIASLRYRVPATIAA